MLKLLTFVLTATFTLGCNSYSTYVDSDDSALGRVVVYRNGVAYFERRAIVDEDQLTLQVPHDKVDDFLKSLTVTDRKTGKTLPVSFPTRGAAEDGTVEMTIRLEGDAPHDLFLSYITESPAWKPSYRLTIADDAKVKVQGWAIVDNTSGEDWKNIRLGVGSSSALSFRYDLRSIRTVHREQLNTGQQFAYAPPMGGSVHTDAKSGRRVFAQLSDGDIPRPLGHPDHPASDTSVSLSESAPNGRASGRHGTALSASKTARPRRYDRTRLRKLAEKLKSSNKQVTLEGYAKKDERDANARSLDRANLLRNQLIREGVAPAQLQVRGAGYKSGIIAGVQLVQTAPSDDQLKEENQGQTPDNLGNPIGRSHFESKVTTSVPRGTSAMVSMLNEDTSGHLVYLYDPEAKRGNKRFAFRAVRFKNPSDSTLESGPVTVYGEGRFIGEGLSEPIPPNATAVVPFALDRQVVVATKEKRLDRITSLVTLNRGILTAEVEHTRRTKLKITNRMAKATTVLIRHSVPRGWTLSKGPELFEKLGASHLFEVPFKAGETRTVTIVESTPIRRTLDLRTPVGIDLVRVYLRTPHDDQRFVAPMGALLKIHEEMANHRTSIASLRERLSEYRDRLSELHMQIVSLKAFKAGGSLMRHLRAKMREISNKVQKLTLNVVDQQEKMMMARIRFQDGLSELALTPKITQKNKNDSGS